MRLFKILVVCSAVLPMVCLVSLVVHHRRSSDPEMGFSDASVLPDGTPSKTNYRLLFPENSQEKFLGGILAPESDDNACTSRSESHLYRKRSSFKPSSYLVSKLRRYEDLHRKCGPGTKSFDVWLEQIRSGKKLSSSEPINCKYVIWIPFSGLGNKVLSLGATFLYALLTDRVLLVDRGSDMEDLFCEPFPKSSWFLPSNFHLTDQLKQFDQNSSVCYGNLLKNKALEIYEESSLPSYVYLHLVHDYGDHDKMFFCDGDQSILAKVPLLIIKSNNYFVPSLFLTESFSQELSKLFPDKGAVFHHLGRYLFHPTNVVWGLITRYYHTYMAKADERIGIQVRVFDSRPGPLKHVVDQILACTLNEKLLPEVHPPDFLMSPSSGSRKLKSVILTSLNLGYSEVLNKMYWESPTTTGEVVGVYQPSHEEFQQPDVKGHSRRAWAEMYLLSLTDVLVTSSWSTFGYVAQGLGGLRPWILHKPENDTIPNPPCGRAMSMEPCFHAPPFYDCKANRGTDTGALVPHVVHCEDMSWGLKLIDPNYKW